METKYGIKVWGKIAPEDVELEIVIQVRNILLIEIHKTLLITYGIVSLVLNDSIYIYTLLWLFKTKPIYSKKVVIFPFFRINQVVIEWGDFITIAHRTVDPARVASTPRRRTWGTPWGRCRSRGRAAALTTPGDSAPAAALAARSRERCVGTLRQWTAGSTTSWLL